MTELETAQAEATKAKRAAARAVERAETAAAVEAEKLENAKRKEKEARNGIIFDRYLSGVKAAIAAQSKTPYEITGAGNYFSVRQGPGVSISVRLVEECSSWSYARPYNGKWRAHAGDYGNRKHWPERKDGSHNYEAIAEFIIADLDRQHGWNVRHDKKRDNKKAADNLALNYDLAESGRVSVEATADTEAPVCVSVRFTRECTIAEAGALLKKLEAAGVTFR
jgi:hypothetical protein